MIGEFVHSSILPNRQRTVKSVFAYQALASDNCSSDDFAMLANDRPNRIEELREDKGLTIEQLSEKTGISVSYLSRMANGKRNLSVKNINKIAAALDVTPKDLLTEDMAVSVVGYVGAGAAMHHYASADHPNEYVPMPIGGTENTVAVEIRGSSLGSIFDTWLVYYDEIRRPPTPDMIGKLCVVGLDNDQVLVKKLRRGSAPDLFNLESVTESLIEDVTILWAARVRSMTPR
jgi:transcriptional regulator with XRE-family HTH domain